METYINVDKVHN